MDYKFYHQLEQILGQEAMSIDEFDERDDQAAMDPGAASKRSHLLVAPEQAATSHRSLDILSACRVFR